MDTAPRRPSPASSRDAVRALEIEVSEGPVRVRVLGRGRPILFLHGLSAHGRSWREVARRLTADRHDLEAWIPDLLGRGASAARPEVSYALDDEVRRVRAVVGALCSATGRRARLPDALVGHSQGAAIALALAADERKVPGLVLSNPIGPDIRRPRSLDALRSATVRRMIAAAFRRFRRPLGRLILRRAGGPHFRPDAELVRAYVAPYADSRRVRTLMRILADWRPAELEGRMPVRAPVAHVLAGAHDPRVPQASAERLARRLGARYTLVEDGGHVLPEQHPGRLARAVAGIADAVHASATERDG